jgi:Glycosyltransferases involved in cell wall biogenesis
MKHLVKNSRSEMNPQLATPVENSKNPKVSVIIPVYNESRTIARIIMEARDVHPQTEVIVVDNGSTDGSAEIAEQMGAKVIRYPSPLGYDVGRCIGAKAAKGDMMLFIDGDFVINSGQLVPFIQALERGVDVALNKYEGPDRLGRVRLSKRVLNEFLSSPHLGAASMATVPHALSQKALKVITCEQLMVPPKAQAIAVLSGLVVEPVSFVDVGALNPRRKSPDSVEDLIVGDHLEAIHWILTRGDSRANYPDFGRKREKVRD